MKLILSAVLAVALAGPALAFGDPDWPCESRKVVRLSTGQMWPGALPEDDRAWRADAELAQSAALIAARRTPMTEVGALIDRIAASERGKERLPQLFLGVFQTIDDQRAQIVDGIVRYALKQRALAAKVDAAQVELATLEAETKPDDHDALDRLDELRDAVTWDVRIYDERRRSLQFVCESPVLLEKRLFEVARMIQARLGDG